MLTAIQSWLQQLGAQRRHPPKAKVRLLAHTHGTVSGWLVPFEEERNYVVNNHVSHLEYAKRSPDYAFAVSEVPNLIALKELRSDGFNELQRQLAAGRAELVNAFFLEPTINLTMGETLMRMGIEGQRWQREVMRCNPKFAWMIDVVGVHGQMPALVAHLGLKAMVYSRNCPGSATHHWESDAGDKILSIALGRDCYLNWRLLFNSAEPFGQRHVEHLHKSLEAHLQYAPAGFPVLWVVAEGDYGRAPVREDQVALLLEEWRDRLKHIELGFALPTEVLLECQSLSDRTPLPVVRGDGLFSYNAFWANNPTVKQRFRSTECRLLTVEAEAALASAISSYRYPAQALHDAWHLLFLNADRGILWGIGSGEAFYGETSWSAQDRFETAASILDDIEADGGEHRNPAELYFNIHSSPSLGYVRACLDPPNRSEARTSDSFPEHELVLPSNMEGLSFTTLDFGKAPPPNSPVDLPREIKTSHYIASVCPASGCIQKLTLPARRPIEIVALHANRIRFEKQPGVELPEDFLAPRVEREKVQLIHEPATITCSRDSISIMIEARERLVTGGTLIRRMRFFDDILPIDAEIEIDGVPDGLLVSVDFPLATAITTEARGVPYGFSERDTSTPKNIPPGHFLMIDHAWYGVNSSTVPAIAWSWHGDENGHGLAILDRGIPGRESHGRTASLLLMNTSSGFRGKKNSWLSGKSRQHFRYSIVPTSTGWREARIPAHAAMLNFPIRRSYLDAQPATLITSSPNLTICSIRRDRAFLEMRFVEAFGKDGPAWLSTSLPHGRAFKGTAWDAGLLLHGAASERGKRYEFQMKPQEIATFRMELDSAADLPGPRLTWEDLIPHSKRAKLFAYDPTLAGHPPE